MRRRPADPGLRPRGRFCAGRCRGCGTPYVIDQIEQRLTALTASGDLSRAEPTPGEHLYGLPAAS